MVYWERLGSSLATVWLKYLGQSIWTWQILLREKPDAVFVMSPPVFAGLVVIPYCVMRRIPFVIDAHTGAFLNPRWRYFQRLQHWICRRAATTIVTNTHLKELLDRNGADSTILPDVPVRYPESAPRLTKTEFTVAVICSFVYDEPIDVIVDTVRALPDVRFLMTGNARRVPQLQGELPANLQLTGFLDTASYGQLLRDADVVMALTTAKHTMLRAAYEAIYQGTPIIVSDSSLLRQEFPKGAVTVENSADKLVEAVREVQSNYDRYRCDARGLRDAKQRRWESNKKLLVSKIWKGLRR